MAVAAGQRIGAPPRKRNPGIAQANRAASAAGVNVGPHAGRGLGLGLGLSPGKRKAIRQDLAVGNTGAASTLAGGGARPGARMRFNRLLDPTNTTKAAGRAQSMFGASNPAGYAAPGMPAPPGAVLPGTAPGGVSGAGAPVGTTPAGSPTPNAPGAAPAGTPPSFQDLLNQQFGTGNPFDPSGTNTAFKQLTDMLTSSSNYNLQKQLGGIRSRYGAGGLGDSSREALAEGSATGEQQAGLDQTLGQLGFSGFEQDRDRALNALLGAGQLQLGQEQLPLSALNSLISAGGGFLGLEGSEQVPPIIQFLLPYLNLGGTQTTSGTSTQR